MLITHLIIRYKATIASAKKGSISSLGRLKALVRVADCPQDRLLRILPSLYHHLNPKRVPLPGVIPFPNTIVELAMRALDILAATRPILIADEPQTLTIRSLAQFWPSMWSWLLFFLTQYTLKTPQISALPVSQHLWMPSLPFQAATFCAQKYILRLASYKFCAKSGGSKLRIRITILGQSLKRWTIDYGQGSRCACI